LCQSQDSAGVDKISRWDEGGPLVFDDTVEHEAWNYSADTRTVLLFDFLRPGRTMDEFDEMPPEVAAALHRRASIEGSQR
jgi:beta-hydroxylase